MKINNPVIRAGSVTPNKLALPALRFNQPSTITLPGTGWNIAFTLDLTDKPGFGDDFRGTYMVETQFVLLGTTVDCPMISRLATVSGAATVYSSYENWTVPANETNYHHSFRSYIQATASLYTVTLYLNNAVNGVKMQGQAGAPDDWTWCVVTKTSGPVS